MVHNLNLPEPDPQSENEATARSATDEKLCRAMVNNITEYAVILTDPKGYIISLNKGAELILGYEQAEVIGKTIALFYPPETLPTDGPAMNLQEALVNNNYEIKGWRLKKNGVRFLANIQYTALYDDDHVLLGYTKIIYELSEGKVAENEKKQNSIGANISFRKLIENSYSGITLLDKNLNVIYRSLSATRITGWNTAERMKNGTDGLIHPDDRERVLSLLNDALNSPGIPKPCTFQSMHPDGHYVWLSCVYTNFLNEPNVNAIVCNFIDVTEERKSKDELIKSENRFKSLLENGSDGISVLGLDRKPIYLSPGFNRILGYTEEEASDPDFVQIIHPEDLDAAISKFRECLSNPGTPVKNVIYRVRHKNGHYVYLDATLSNFLKDPVIGGIVNNFRDITGAKIAEAKIVESERFIKTITDNVPAMIAYWTTELRCLFANKPYSELYHIDPSVAGPGRAELMEKYKINESYINGVLAGERQNYESSFVKPNGERVYTQSQYIPDKVAGVTKGFYSLIYDITELKLAGIEIRKKTSQIESLLENITDGFIALDENMCYTYANKQIGIMTGHTAESLIGKYIWDVFPDAVGSNTYKAIQQAFTEKVYVSNEDHYPPLNLWQENRVYPTEGGVSVFIRDITQRKIDEQQKALLAAIGNVFNESFALNDILLKSLKKLVDYGNFNMAEAWLISSDKKRANLCAKCELSPQMKEFYKDSGTIKSFVKGQGLPGMVWETGTIHFLTDLAENELFLRKKAAGKAGLKNAYGIPLYFKSEIIGILILGTIAEEKQGWYLNDLFENVSRNFGVEIRRKQLEEELNQLFNSAPDIICTAGSDGYFKKVNPALISLLGYTELELLNRPFIEFIHPDDKIASLGEFTEVNNGNAVTYFENRYITRLGKEKWLAWTTSAASPEGLIFCVAKDITDKKELEDLLKKANNLARIGSWEIDLLKGTVYWSDITKEIHEVDAEFKPDLETALSYYKEGFSREFMTYKIKEAIDKGISWDVELEIITAKGSDKWIRVIGEAQLANNKCTRVYGSFQDIDARKRAELSVTEVLEERNTILESIGDAFFAVDKNWTVTYWNNMAEKVLHTPKQEMLNRNLWEVFASSVESLSYKKYHEAVATCMAMHFEDYFAPLDKWYEISAYPSENGLSVYFKDVTERKISDTRLKELNESLRLQAKELATSNAELEQFAYVASHDLQEPLRMITSFLTQIERKYNHKLDDKGRQYINFAVDGAKRMRQIILDLLEFSRVGSMDDSLEEINLGKLIGEISALYRKQIDEKKASISYSDLPVITSYKTPVRQIFQNLISNSLKYNNGLAKPEIEISCKETDASWQFALKDNGIGIESEYFDKIFVIFQRLHNKDEYTGTGMGLAITKKIVENLGGMIWVESEKGKGSTFYFTILKS